MNAASMQDCIRCGDCLPVCPEGLAPVWLAEQVLAGNDQMAAKLGLSSCTGCGACELACPSQIPLANVFVDAWNANEQTRWQALNADQWRDRHQWREARLIRTKRDRAERLAAKAVNKLDDPHFAAADKQAKIESAIVRAAEALPDLASSNPTSHSSDALDAIKRARIHDIMNKAQARREAVQPASPPLPDATVTHASQAKHAKIAEAMAKAAALRGEPRKP